MSEHPAPPPRPVSPPLPLSPPRNVHATVVALGGFGILIRGRSRSGKSALALSALRRAEAAGLDAALVSDDQVFLSGTAKGRVEALAPEAIRGLIEISGVGILDEASIDRAFVDLVVDLEEPQAIQRMPDSLSTDLCGLVVRRIVLPAREASFGADVILSLLKTLGVRHGDGPRL